jgi:MFS family permease
MATHQVGILTWNAATLHGLTRQQILAGSPALGHQLSNNQDFGIKVAAPVGNLFGQLLFGWLADIVGRKRMCK